MDDTLFENKYITTKEILREFYSALIIRRPAFIAITSAITCGIIANAVFLILGVGETKQMYLCVFLLLLFIGLSALRVNQAVKIQLKQEQELFRGRKREVIIRAGDDFTSVNEMTGSVIHIDYSLITEWKQTKHLLILSTKSKIYLTFKKDSFTAGTYDGFIDFLNGLYPRFRLLKKCRPV